MLFPTEMASLKGHAPLSWVETRFLGGEYISEHKFIPLIHPKSGSLSFLFFDFRRQRAYIEQWVWQRLRKHKSESHWKIHFLSWDYIVFIILTPEADRIFGQGHSMILSPYSNNCSMENGNGFYMKKQKSNILLLVKKRKKLIQWVKPVDWLNICKISILYKLIYKCNIIPFKIPVGHFSWMDSKYF